MEWKLSGPDTEECHGERKDVACLIAAELLALPARQLWRHEPRTASLLDHGLGTRDLVANATQSEIAKQGLAKGAY